MKKLLTGFVLLLLLQPLFPQGAGWVQTYTKYDFKAPINIGNGAKIGGIVITSSAADLNKLSGSTFSAADLNLVAGGTSNFQSQINLRAPINAPNFTGVPRLNTTDTLSTQAYARAHGSGGGGSGGEGSWGSITGTLSTQTDLQNALNAKLSTNGSAASLIGFPTFNQNTTGSAAKWTTPRSIYGNSVDGSTNVTNIISSSYGGTGNGFIKFSGPTTSEKVFTLPDVSSTILTSNSSVTIIQGGTGRNTSTIAYGLIAAGTTPTGVQQTLTTGTSGQILRSGGSGALPGWSTATYPSTASTTGKILISDGNNVVNSTPAYPNTAATSGKIIIANGTDFVTSTATYPMTAGTINYVVKSDGTNLIMAPSPGGAWGGITGTLSAQTDLMAELNDSINDVDIPVVYNTQSGTAYNVALTDKNKVIEMTSSSTNTVTILQNSSVNFPLNIPVMVTMGGTGQTSIVAGTNVTIHSPSSYLKVGARYAYVIFIQRSTNVWDLTGSLIP
jgi:hypothetical protein